MYRPLARLWEVLFDAGPGTKYPGSKTRTDSAFESGLELSFRHPYG